MNSWISKKEDGSECEDEDGIECAKESEEDGSECGMKKRRMGAKINRRAPCFGALRSGAFL